LKAAIEGRKGTKFLAIRKRKEEEPESDLEDGEE